MRKISVSAVAALCALLLSNCNFFYFDGHGSGHEEQQSSISAPSVTAEYQTLVDGVATTGNPKPKWNWNDVSGAEKYRYGFTEGNWISASSVVTEYTPANNLADGTYTLFVQAGDGSGEWSVSGSFTLAIDTKPPQAPVVSGASPTSNPTPTWTWTAVSGAVSYRYGFSEGNWISESSVLRYTPPTPLSEGSHTLYVQARNALDKWSVSGSRTIVIDFSSAEAPVAPVVTGKTPTNDKTPQWIWGAVQGAVTYRLGWSESSWIGESAATTYSPSQPLEEGSHTLYVQAKSSNGSWSASGSFTILIDATAPSLAITAPLSGATVKADAGIGFTDSEPSAPQVSIDNLHWTAAESGVTTLGDIPEFGGLPEGSFTLYLRDTDPAGNTGTDSESGILKVTTGTAHVTINLITPTDADIELNGSDLALDKKVPEILNVTAVLAGASAFEWYLDGARLSDAAGDTCTIDSRDRNPGPYTLALIVTRNGVRYSAELRFTIFN